jgi:uncharacterized protein YidB (DUF937 family)
MDFYNYILNNFPHRNDQEKVGVGTALAALFGHPHPQQRDAAPDENGLADVVSRFDQAGLGDAARSWVGNGPNQAIGPDDVQRALGEERVRGLAQQSGMSTTQLLPLLAQYLPMIVDRMTPNGQMPRAGAEGGLLGALSGILGRR